MVETSIKQKKKKPGTGDIIVLEYKVHCLCAFENLRHRTLPQKETQEVDIMVENGIKQKK